MALSREGLLAKAVLEKKTKGYTHHPQLLRFKTCEDSLSAITAYLHGVLEESLKRNYHFDEAKLPPLTAITKIEETEGQLQYEWTHLLKKLEKRSPRVFEEVRLLKPIPHPLFEIVPGEIRDWEIIA